MFNFEKTCLKTYGGTGSPHSLHLVFLNEKTVTLCDWFSVLCIKLCISGVSNSRPAGLFRPSTSFYVARESIWLSLQKKKKPMLLYIIHYEVCINTTSFCSICRSVYMQKLTLVCVYTQWFFHWWWLRGRLQRNKADLIKCSSTIDGKTRCSPFI